MTEDRAALVGRLDSMAAKLERMADQSGPMVEVFAPRYLRDAETCKEAAAALAMQPPGDGEFVERLALALQPSGYFIGRTQRREAVARVQKALDAARLKKPEPMP